MEKANGRKRTTNGPPTGDQVRPLAEEDGEEQNRIQDRQKEKVRIGFPLPSPHPRERIQMSDQKPLFDPDFCEHRCPVCTKARKGNRFAQFLQAIESIITFGGCPWGRARQKKYGVKPNESLPVDKTPTES
jgi:hypothetical protein